MHVISAQILQRVLSVMEGKAESHAASGQTLNIRIEITPRVSKRRTPPDMRFDTRPKGIRMFLSMVADVLGSVAWNICSTVSSSRWGASRRRRQQTSPGLCHQKKIINADSVIKEIVITSKREKGKCWTRRPIQCKRNQASCTQVIACERISIFASYKQVSLHVTSVERSKEFTLAMSDSGIFSRTIRLRSIR